MWWANQDENANVCKKETRVDLSGSVVPLSYRLDNTSGICTKAPLPWKDVFQYQVDQLLMHNVSTGLFLINRGNKFFTKWRDYLVRCADSIVRRNMEENGFSSRSLAILILIIRAFRYSSRTITLSSTRCLSVHLVQFSEFSFTFPPTDAQLPRSRRQRLGNAFLSTLVSRV